MADFLPPLIAEVRADISQYSAQMATARGETAKLASEGSSNMSKFASVGKTALLGLGAVAVAAGVLGVKAAMEQEEATARLGKAIENSGQSFSRYKDEIAQAEKAAINLGFADEDLDTSLAKLVPVTANVHEGVKLMGLAEDIARGRHIDLSAATDILVKVQTGHVAMLAKIGINTKDATGATISQEEAIKRLSALYGGQASTYAETFAGKLAVLEAKAGEVAEKIGFFLIPIITGLGGALADSITWLTEHKEVAMVLAVVVGGVLVAAMTAYIATSLIAFATTGALGVALSALVTLALTAAAGLESLAVALGVSMTVATGGAILAVAAVVGLVAVVAGGEGPYERLTAAGDKWAASTIKQAAALTGTDAGLVSLKASQRLLSSAMDDQNAAIKRNEQAHLQGKITLEESNLGNQKHSETILRLKTEYDDLTPAVKKAQAAHDASVAQAVAVRGALDSIAAGTLKVADASVEELKAIQAVTNAMLAAQGGEIGYAQAQLNASDAQAKLTALQNSGTATVDQLTAATLAVQSANLQAAAAAIKLSDDNATMAQVLQTQGVGGLQAMIVKLEEQQSAHGDASGAVQGEIDKINDLIHFLSSLPPTVTTTISVDADAAMSKIQSLMYKYGALGGAHGLVGGAHGLVGLARGGAGMIVGPRQPVIIGEGLSREAVVPFDNFGDMVSTIRNTGAASMFASAAAAAGGGSGATVHHHTHTGNIIIQTPDGAGARRHVAAFLEGRR